MKVLIAEDDEHIGNGLCSILEDEGYATVLVRDGRSALERFEAEIFVEARANG